MDGKALTPRARMARIALVRTRLARCAPGDEVEARKQLRLARERARELGFERWLVESRFADD